jgi:fructose-specific phosphotransferase system IIC component
MLSGVKGLKAKNLLAQLSSSPLMEELNRYPASLLASLFTSLLASLFTSLLASSLASSLASLLLLLTKLALAYAFLLTFLCTQMLLTDLPDPCNSRRALITAEAAVRMVSKKFKKGSEAEAAEVAELALPILLALLVSLTPLTLVTISLRLTYSTDPANKACHLSIQPS